MSGTRWKSKGRCSNVLAWSAEEDNAVDAIVGVLLACDSVVANWQGLLASHTPLECYEH